MLVLGIDPGSRVTGYGLVKKSATAMSYIASGCIRLSNDTLAARLYQLHAAMTQLINQYQPDVVAIEKVFMHKNFDSVMKLGQARGVLILAAAAITKDIFEYSPREVKQAVVGYGAAEKAQIQAMVASILKLSTAPQQDAADALAIAICHINQHKLAAMIKN